MCVCVCLCAGECVCVRVCVCVCRAAWGMPLRMAAAVRVLPCTTRTRRSGRFLTKRAPPPLSACVCAVCV